MLIIIAGILFMGCGQSHDSSEEPSNKPIVETSAPRSSNPIEAKRVDSEMQAPFVEQANPKADLDLIDASMKGNIESHICRPRKNFYPPCGRYGSVASSNR